MADNDTPKLEKTKSTGVKRRGQNYQRLSSYKKTEEIEIPDAPFSHRKQAFLIDMIFLIVTAEFFTFRHASKVFIDYSEATLGRAIVYALVFVLFYILPMRIFGQSLGMKFAKIKILNAKDLSYVTLSTLIQRQSFGLVLSGTVGLKGFLDSRAILADQTYETKIVEIEKNKKS